MVQVITSSVTSSQYPSATAVLDWGDDMILEMRSHWPLLEYVENKVTSISSSSTDTQYPSAKCVYDAIETVDSSLNYRLTNVEDNKEDSWKKVTSIGPSSTDAQYPSAKCVYDAIQAIPSQVQSDWQQNDTTAPDYIKHRPSLPSAQIQSDWTQTNSNEVDYIKHKPSLSAVATSGSYNDLSNKPTLATVATTGSYSDLSGKPSFATVATSGSYTDLSDKPIIPAGQIQSDWSQTNTGSLDYIKNKPNMSLKEDVSNKVTTLSAQSTDTQYPSAKATYKILSDVESMLEDTEETVQTWLTYKEDLSNKSQQFRDNTANMVNYPSTIAVVDYVVDKMSGLDYTDSVSGDYVTSVSETDGVISLTKGSKGTITSGSTGLVDGDTVYTALQNLPVVTQIQSDWDESDTTDPSYIQNKPNLNLKEDISNKVTSLSSSSTDTQYPSAKAVYDSIQSSGGTKYVHHPEVITNTGLPIPLSSTDYEVGDVHVYHINPSNSSSSYVTKTIFSVDNLDTSLWRVEQFGYTVATQSDTYGKVLAAQNNTYGYNYTYTVSVGGLDTYKYTFFVTRLT